MNKLIPFLAAACLLGLASTAMASTNDTQETRFYVAPMASYTMPNDTLGLGGDNQFGGQLSIGKNFGDYFALELYGFYYPDVGLDSSFGADANTDISGYGISGLFFPARDLFPVYAVAGVGLGQIDFDQSTTGLNDQDSKFYDVGVGYMMPLNDYGVKLRAEYRYRSSNVDVPSGPHANARSNIVSIGLQIPLSAPPQPPVPQTPTVIVKPKPVPVPVPVVVAPTDSDGDGVIDSKDECPTTLHGFEVDANGCPMQEQAPVVLRGVTFEFDSAKLTAQARNRLVQIVASLKSNPEIKFRIAGYTDSIGSKQYNQRLSQRRAQSVKDYMTAHGIGPRRITAVVGHGESNPVATNQTAVGRAQNRRVELRVTER